MTDTCPCVMAADIGGTKIRYGIFSGDGSCLYHGKRPADAGRGRAAVLASLAACLADARDAAVTRGLAPAAVGISTAGVVDSVGGVITDATDAIPRWRGTPLAKLVRDQHGLPVVVENDVKAALLGELWRAPAAASGSVAMLTLGTGLGGALALDGQVTDGNSHVAGHFGRTRVPSPWVPGETLALDGLVSGTGLANIANQLAGSAHFVDGQAVMAAAIAGDDTASKALAQLCSWLVMVLENIYWSLDPQLVIVGGGLVESRQHWWAMMDEKLRMRSLPLQVQPARLGNDAGMVGAASLALGETGRQAGNPARHPNLHPDWHPEWDLEEPS